MYVSPPPDSSRKCKCFADCANADKNYINFQSTFQGISLMGFLGTFYSNSKYFSDLNTFMLQFDLGGPSSFVLNYWEVKVAVHQ